ncbi:MAG: GNAT family N-acetyltransferase [Candidatus Eiseniibacteriota bacterium]|jgi:ribosomal protein S18 acetylase RimI-like enzyme
MTDERGRRAVTLHDHGQIEPFLRRDPALHIYELGDLDPFFWGRTTWYGLRAGRGSGSADGTARHDAADAAPDLAAIVLVYTGLALPTVIGLADEGDAALAELLDAVRDRLPARFYAHLSPGAEEMLGARYALEPHGEHAKMALVSPSRLDEVDVTSVETLAATDLPELLEFYAAAYPGNWFDARMLETGAYCGIRRAGRLVSVAGVHVVSERYRVAALGNIATLPDHRGRGLARAVTARLCRSLLGSVDTIGLNVAAGNQPAIRCYTGLGFQRVARYGEFEARWSGG